jgi:hypothetical protein
LNLQNKSKPRTPNGEWNQIMPHLL